MAPGAWMGSSVRHTGVQWMGSKGPFTRWWTEDDWITWTILSGCLEAYRQCGVVHTPWMVLEGISLVARIGGDVSQEV